jgi:hypothetical protein
VNAAVQALITMKPMGKYETPGENDRKNKEHAMYKAYDTITYNYPGAD